MMVCFCQKLGLNLYRLHKVHASFCANLLSHPAWGAWIEIVAVLEDSNCVLSHPAWGAWIEIFIIAHPVPPPSGRTPHGVRGLKS